MGLKVAHQRLAGISVGDVFARDIENNLKKKSERKSIDTIVLVRFIRSIFVECIITD